MNSQVSLFDVNCQGYLMHNFFFSVCKKNTTCVCIRVNRASIHLLMHQITTLEPTFCINLFSTYFSYLKKKQRKYKTKKIYWKLHEKMWLLLLLKFVGINFYFTMHAIIFSWFYLLLLLKVFDAHMLSKLNTHLQKYIISPKVKR